MRKSFVKVLALAPVMLVALTACQASLSSDKAKERAAGYDSAVLADYDSVTVKTTYSNIKATGQFEKMADLLEDDEYNDQPENNFCTEEAIASIEDHLNKEAHK